MTGKNIQILIYVVSRRHPLLIGLIVAAFPLQRWHLDTLEEQRPTVWLLAKHAIPKWRSVNRSSSTRQFNGKYLQILDYIDTETRKIILSWK